MSDNDNNSVGNNAKLTKTRNLAIVVTAVLLFSSALIILLPSIKKLLEKPKPDNLPMYSDKLISFNFYPTDYDLDITSYPEYMDLDRYVYYTVNGESIAITDGNYAKYGSAAVFFGKYFDTVIAGDSETYNTFFTNHYYETNEPHWEFAPQMLYEINVEQLSREVSDKDGSIRYAFNVSYKIYRNDGTFRNDIPSDASKVLYFELLEKDGTVLIDRITYRVAVGK